MNACHESFRRGIDYGRIPGSHWWSKRKWILLRECVFNTAVVPNMECGNQYVQLARDGRLTERRGYACDGVTLGIDALTSMRGAFVHDGLCQLTEEGLLPWSYRQQIDRQFFLILVEDQFPEWWSRLRYRAIRIWSRGRQLLSHISAP